MRTTALHATYFITIGIIILLFSALAFSINHFWFHYFGNNYFPKDTLTAAIALLLMISGFHIQGEKYQPALRWTRELLFFYLTMSAIALLTNAIQYTPFPIIDSKLIALETFLHIDMVKLLAWTAAHPFLKQLLNLSYNSLALQMAFLPLLMIWLGKLEPVREYYFLLLITAALGFAIYYFFPTTAPASHFNSPFFLEEQKATGIKFMEIHNYIPVSTIEGGLIAFPSFHAIWACCCLYLVRRNYWLLALLLPINCLMLASCVLLGWHYLVDLTASAIIFLIALGILRWATSVNRLNHSLL